MVYPLNVDVHLKVLKIDYLSLPFAKASKSFMSAIRLAVGKVLNVQLVSKWHMFAQREDFILHIFVSTEKRNPAFLPLQWKTKILSIEENLFIFFLFQDKNQFNVQYKCPLLVDPLRCMTMKGCTLMKSFTI